MNTDLTLESLGPQDILIQPDLGDLRPMDFADAWEAVDLGEAEARGLRRGARPPLPIRRMSTYSSVRQRPATGPRQPSGPSPWRMDRPSLPGSSWNGWISIPGWPLDPATLEEDISRIFGLAEFEEVSYHLENENDLNLRLKEKSWGPNYIRFGLTMSDDSRPTPATPSG